MTGLRQTILTVVIAAHVALASTPEQRAIDYLATEVPRWSRENHCFSCHNNGDGVRALYLAAGQKRDVPKQALDETNEWLSRPAQWDDKIADASFKDKKLARIQFAAALIGAFDAGMLTDRRLLPQAAALVAPFQERDGSWVVDPANAAGSPATYGTTLATYIARNVLERAASPEFNAAVSAATKWLKAKTPMNNVDAAALLLALGNARTDAAKMLLANQTTGGGWGPHRTSPAEPFDTALALLALAKVDSAAMAIAKGRAYLIATQLPSGGWPETTRPPGANSYAQHISTSAWAAMALLGSDSERH